MGYYFLSRIEVLRKIANEVIDLHIRCHRVETVNKVFTGLFIILQCQNCDPIQDDVLLYVYNSLMNGS